MAIAGHFKPIGFRIDEDRTEAALEEVAGLTVLPIEIMCIGRVDKMHDPRQICV